MTHFPRLTGEQHLAARERMPEEVCPVCGENPCFCGELQCKYPDDDPDERCPDCGRDFIVVSMIGMWGKGLRQPERRYLATKAN